MFLLDKKVLVVSNSEKEASQRKKKFLETIEYISKSVSIKSNNMEFLQGQPIVNEQGD